MKDLQDCFNQINQETIEKIRTIGNEHGREIAQIYIRSYIHGFLSVIEESLNSWINELGEKKND